MAFSWIFIESLKQKCHQNVPAKRSLAYLKELIENSVMHSNFRVKTCLVSLTEQNQCAYILHTVLCTFPKVEIRRICLKIKSFFSFWSFPLFSWPWCDCLLKWMPVEVRREGLASHLTYRPLHVTYQIKTTHLPQFSPSHIASYLHESYFQFGIAANFTQLIFQCFLNFPILKVFLKL